ncbi:MAG: hypothetical protein Kow00121_13220 [Elainellaceae cyanobacterium]
MTPHILVIDNRISLPRFIAMELCAEGYQVSIHCDDLADLSTIQEINPDLIVLNWEPRRASGLDICRQLRSTDSQIPIVIITAEDESSCQVVLELGAQTYLTKPFSMDDLLRVIQSQLKGKNRLLECCNSN